MLNKIIIKYLGIRDYQEILNKMQNFTKNRNYNSNDEIWMVQHKPVFTQGVNGNKKNILKLNNIPIIQSDRGGQITFHGPGQQIMYVLLNLKRYSFTIRDLISSLEQSVINTLSYFYIDSYSIFNAPGVYVNSKKICSLGLRIKKNFSFHGLALNVKMDLTPFSYINPCGYSDLYMTQISKFIPEINFNYVSKILLLKFLNILKYKYINI